MEIGVREILIVVVGLFIFGILLDGLRRALDSRKNALKVDIKKPRDEEIDEDLFSDYNPELPGGNARIVRESQLPTQSAAFSTESFAADRSAPEGTADQDVFDEEVQSDLFENLSARDEPLLNNNAFLPREDASQAEEEFDDSGFDAAASSSRPVKTQAVESGVPGKSRSRPVTEKKKAPATASPTTDVIAINLSCKQNLINGEDLLKVVLNNGLRFGDMGLFHRIDSLADEEGGKLFSLVNMVKPGSFDVDAMASLETPGVCLFMTLPGPQAPRGAFETMLETAQRIASSLDCDLRDESQSALTKQTIAHYRQRIDDFCRKQVAASQKFDLVD
jgi:cell division protein ZipA